MAIVAFTSSYSVIFLGTPRTEIAEHVKEDVPKTMTVPMFLLVALVVLIGLFPQYSVLLVGGATSELILFLYPAGFLTVISYFNITLLITIGILLLVRKALLKGKAVTVRNTWGCGYDKGDAKVQYTSTSFNRPFLGFLNPFYVREMEFKNIKELFPNKTSFKSKIYDIFEYYIINPLVKFDENVLSKFLWIQSGNLQTYIWYSIIALIFAICLVLGGKI